MITHTAQSVQQKGTIYTELSMSMHPNTTNRKDSSIKRGKQNPKQLYFQHHDYKTYSSIIEKANLQLQDYLFNLNDQIKKVIQKRQSNYIAAFQNHIRLVQKQLKKIKKQAQYANSKERTVSLQQVIHRLERQCTIFRLQAMKYFQLVQEKQEQNKNLKRQISLFKRQLQLSEFSKRKLLQKLKIETAINNFQLIQASPQFHKQFTKSKQKAKENHTEPSSGFKQRKFRKTLLEFDLKNSSEYFKQPTSARRTARSFLTNCSFREDLTSKKFSKKNIHESNLKDVQKKARRVNSVINIACEGNDENSLKTDTLGLLNNNASCLFGQELKLWLKQVMIEKFINKKRISKTDKTNQNQVQSAFQFNLEQGINDFIELIFEPDMGKTKKENLSTIVLETQYTQAEGIKYPFERISTHKKLQRVLDSSIYTVQKTEKEIDFVVGNDSTVRTKVIKRPSKKAVNSSKWIDFRLNKTQARTRTRLQNNLNLYIEKQKQSQK